MDLSPQAWTAVWATALFIAALALLCFGPPLLERLRAEQYRRWDARCAEDEKQWWAARRTAATTTVPDTTPAPDETEKRGLLARLRARNERILRDREARRG